VRPFLPVLLASCKVRSAVHLNAPPAAEGGFLGRWAAPHALFNAVSSAVAMFTANKAFENQGFLFLVLQD
jgi:hypothetical protein